MSFNSEFLATKADAEQILEQENLPESVKAFIKQALTSYKPDALISVKAFGHLYQTQTDYQQSNAEIKVCELSVKKPRA